MAKPRKLSAQTFSFGLEYIQLSLVRTVWILHLPRKSASFLPLLLPLAKVGVLTPSLTGMHQLEFQENDHHDKLAHVNVWWECCWSVVNIQQQAVKATVGLWTLLCSNKISFLLRYRLAWRMQKRSKSTLWAVFIDRSAFKVLYNVVYKTNVCFYIASLEGCHEFIFSSALWG